MAVNDDPVIKQFRDQISDNDLKIADAVNKRLKLVQQLWAYKQSQGLEVMSPEREQWMATYISRANKGPLSDEGLLELYEHIREVTKREAAAKMELPTP